MKSFARRTHIGLHACTSTYIYTYTEIYIHSCIQEFIHKGKPPIIPQTTDNGKVIFIHFGYFYSASLTPLGLLLRGAPDHSN